MVIMDITPIIIKLKKIKIKNSPTHIDLLKCVIEMKKKRKKIWRTRIDSSQLGPFVSP